MQRNRDAFPVRRAIQSVKKCGKIRRERLPPITVLCGSTGRHLFLNNVFVVAHKFPMYISSP